jgi:hypothetical protein
VLLKLNNLYKRIQVIEYILGEWKPTTKKYQNIGEQVEYCRKKLELFDEGKINYFLKRAEAVKEEVRDIYKSTMD